jgi:hypothetical protein
MNPQNQARNRRGQFNPGVSGNPGGRPVGRVSIVEAMRRLAAMPMPKGKDGETVAERIAALVVMGAAQGDARMIALALDRLDGKPAPAPDEPRDEEVTLVLIDEVGNKTEKRIV